MRPYDLRFSKNLLNYLLITYKIYNKILIGNEFFDF